MSLSKWIILAILLPVHIWSYAATVITDEQKQFAETQKKKYPESPVVIRSSDITVEFLLNDKGDAYAQVTEKDLYVSLRMNQNIYVLYPYDSYSAIAGYKLYDHSLKYTIYPEKACGTMQRENIYHHDEKFCSYKLSFKTPGEQARFEVKKKYNDLKYFINYYFSEQYPVLERTITVKIPEWLDIDIREYNFKGYAIEKLSEKTTGGITEVTYRATDLPAVKQESNSRGPSFVYPHLLFLSKTYNNKKGNSIAIIRNKEDLYSWYYSLLRKENPDSGNIKPFTIELIKNCSTPEEKIRTIYYWVQDNIRYIAFEDGLAGFRPEAAETVFANKYGDCKGMSNLLKAMLTVAGIDARLTWLGTNHICYTYSTPSLAADNHMICTVILNGKKIFLDPTANYCSINTVHEGIQGRQVLIENKENFIFDSIPVLDHSINTQKREVELSIQDDLMKGNIRYKLDGMDKAGLLSVYHSTETEAREKAIKYFICRSNNASISDLNFYNQENRDSTLVISANISMKNVISEFNNEVYIPVDPLNEESFPQIDDKRKSDLLFGEKINKTTHFVFKLPQHLKVKELPDNFSYKNEFFEYIVNCSYSGGKILIDKKLIIPKGYVPVEMMNEWNAFQKELTKFNKEQIILTVK